MMSVSLDSYLHKYVQLFVNNPLKTGSVYIFQQQNRHISKFQLITKLNKTLTYSTIEGLKGT